MWFEAFRLAMVEIKKSIVFIVLGWTVTWLAGFIFLSIFNLFESPDPYHDVLLFAVMIAFPLFFRRKVFRIHDDGKHAAPAIVHYMQLPIPKMTIARSRLFIWGVYCLPAYIGLYSFAYFYDGILRSIQIDSYALLFMFILAIGMVTGLWSLHTDFGFHSHIMMKAFIPICVALGVVLYLKSTDFTYDTALFFWLMNVFKSNEMIVLISSMILIGLSIWLFPILAVRKMKYDDF